MPKGGWMDYDGVIFDMDGTIVEPLLDFALIRSELGIAPRQGILEAIQAMPTGIREGAERRLLEHELSAARRVRLLPGARRTIRAVRMAGLKAALLTRNARAPMEMVIDRFGLEFDLAWSREDGPIKPEPHGVLRACQALAIAPHRMVCVGDFHYDILAANAAGAVSVLLSRGERPPYADQARYVIGELTQLPALLGMENPK